MYAWSMPGYMLYGSKMILNLKWSISFIQKIKMHKNPTLPYIID